MEFGEARELIHSLREGQDVVLTQDGRDMEVTVQRAVHHPDGFGSPGSYAVKVGYGVGRYNTSVSISRLTAGFCKLRRATEVESYLRAVRRASVAVVEPYMRADCPECDYDLDPNDPEDHVVIGSMVVIGCQGYWIVNPNVVGIEKPNWCDWTDPSL
jgi:hypothetical protein